MAKRRSAVIEPLYEAEFTVSDVRDLARRLSGALGRIPGQESRQYEAAVVRQVEADLLFAVMLLSYLAGVLEADTGPKVH